MTRAISAPSFVIGLGAGLATALLFASLVGGSVFALPLFFLTPLPLAIAALGWGTAAGVIATLTAAATAAWGFGGQAAAALGFGFALPTLIAAHLLGLARPSVAGDPKAAPEWYPIGRVLAAIAATVCVGTIAGGVLSGFDVDTVSSQIVEIWRQASTEEGVGSVAGHEAAQILPYVRAVVRLMPVVFPAFGVGVIVFDLWAATWIVRRSGRLVRPTEDLAAVELPIAAALVFAAALALVFVGGGLGLVAEVVIGALFTAHTLVGLGVLHSLARRSEAKIVILAFVYGLVLLFEFPLALMALAGLVEPWVGLRRRPPPGRSRN